MFIVFSLIIINLLIAVTGEWWGSSDVLLKSAMACKNSWLPQSASPPRMTVNRMSCKSKFSLKTFLLVTGSVMYPFQRLLRFEDVSYEVKFCISNTKFKFSQYLYNQIFMLKLDNHQGGGINRMNPPSGLYMPVSCVCGIHQTLTG